MKTSAAGLALIQEFEGFSAKPYRCPAGVPTIGYGSTRYEDGRRVSMSDPPISESRASQILAATLSGYELAVLSTIGIKLLQHEFDALVSFTYNLGSGNLSASSLARKLNAGDRAGAAGEFLRWNKAGGQVLAGLTRRREAERRMFLGQA